MAGNELAELMAWNAGQAASLLRAGRERALWKVAITNSTFIWLVLRSTVVRERVTAWIGQSCGPKDSVQS